MISWAIAGLTDNWDRVNPIFWSWSKEQISSSWSMELKENLYYFDSVILSVKCVFFLEGPNVKKFYPFV